ncbi:CoA-transferase [Euzebya sp.]|uniref:CoA transferase subunit A n=1 Tax=Euzebya sp. TaxID=1971409 RepID=UPI00351673AA
MQSKVRPLEALGDIVGDGATVALGGAWFANHPMAAVRQLLRDGRRGLHVMSLIGSVDTDLLLGAGDDVVERLTFSMVTLEAFGLAPNLRRRVEGGSLEIVEMTALSMEAALDAAGRNLPFMPYPGLGSPPGSAVPGLHPDLYVEVEDPFGGPPVTLVKALRPEVAIVHATRADASGNAQFDGSFAIDDDLAKAADVVVVTCEEVVPTDVIAANPHATKIPGFLVDVVIEAPFGAHPTTHVPRYGLDGWQMLEYAEAALEGGPAFERYVEQLAAEDEAAYRRRVLGDGRGAVLEELARQGRVLEGVRS